MLDDDVYVRVDSLFNSLLRDNVDTIRSPVADYPVDRSYCRWRTTEGEFGSTLQLGNASVEQMIPAASHFYAGEVYCCNLVPECEHHFLCV